MRRELSASVVFEQIEGDARRLVDRERQRLRRGSAQVQFQLNLLSRQRLNVDRLEFDRVGGMCLKGDG